MNENTRTASASVEVRIYPSGTLLFCQAIGDGEVDGEPVEISQNIGSGTILVRFGDVEWYAFTLKALIEAALAVRRGQEELHG